MRIYVATKYEERETASRVMDWLRSLGHIVTYDWTRNEQNTSVQAWYDLQGVLSADALLLLVEKDLSYCGALVELGLALGRGIPVYVLGTSLDSRCIFMNLREVRHITTLSEMF